MRKYKELPFIFYAVARGRHIGIFDSYYPCLDSITAYPGAVWRGFYDRFDAEKWLDAHMPKQPA